ncbi:hypothetical membrane protein [Corynebacterium imitans]|nr:hypothetical protein [Corynebacterium imitans]SNV60903.1 hypothetical membrane protein [Corynebacterium imitans]
MTNKDSSKQTPKPAMDLDTAERLSGSVPPLMRFGAVIVLVQCLAIFVYAASLIYNQLMGASDSTLESDSAAVHFVSLGTAIFLLIIFGFIAFVAVSTLRGKPRSTGAIVLIEAILTGVAFYMFSGGAILLGIATLLSTALVLYTVFNPESARYNEARYELRKAQR